MKKKILIKASGITAPSWRGYNAGVGRSTLMLLKSLAKISNLPFDIEIYASGLSSVGFENVTWRECTLINWLNESFFDIAFNTQEKKVIKFTNVVNSVGQNTKHKCTADFLLCLNL